MSTPAEQIIAEAAARSNGNGHAPATVSLRTVRADAVRMRSIDWVDKPHLQRSAFILVAGPKGVGKGTYISRVATKFSLGTYGDARNVLVISSEDSMEVDSTPRLVAAGADLTRVTFITDNIILPRDIEKVRALALDIGDVGLIDIDPVGNHLGGVDTDKEGLVRHAIGGLNQLADDLECTILGVRHISKSRQNGALASVLGSTAWVDVPRAVLMFARDDEDDMVFHVQVVAGNRSGRGSGRSYRIELRDIDGLTEPVTCAIELGDSAKDVEDLLTNHRPASRSQSARELILDILEENDHAQESDQLDARVARETGLAAKTVKNARTKLTNEGLIKTLPDKDETGAIVCWKVSRTQAART